MLKNQDINFDGLVGPTHNFAGLSFGNIASKNHAQQKSYPKKAALQGLEKMAALMRLGLPQGVLPPHERIHMPSLRALGFTQSAAQLIPRLAQHHPLLLRQMSSASPMWVANAATTSPAADTLDQKTHFTPANLSSMLHRSIEHEFTGQVLHTIFSDQRYFTHHQALPGTAFFGDEGAANHTRFCAQNGDHGLEFFVYGQSFFTQKTKPTLFPARQSLEASQAVSRLHQLTPKMTIFAQQNPLIIDQGVFHNDVIAVGSKNILLCHEQAFVDQTQILARIQQQQELHTNEAFYIIEAKETQVSVQDAVSSYLFNTQIVFPSPQQALLIAPIECLENTQVKQFIDHMIAGDNPFTDVQYFDLRQSMHNGGGPACLRFRVTLTPAEIASLTTNTLLTETLYQQLKQWITTYYRDEIVFDDLADPDFYLENVTALDQLSQILCLGDNLYDFQKV